MFFQNQPITKIVKKVMPAVVSISISENLEKIPDGLIDLKSRNKLKKKIGSLKNVEVGNGSGFFIDEEGIILTNKHIIADPNAEYFVITNDKKKLKAEIIARDPINDIAILKINDSSNKFPVLELGNSNAVELGENVIAFGNALGIFSNTVSAGIVSGLSRNISAQLDLKSESQEMRGLIQTDAAINPGNSGGPLINSRGKVIGINAVTVFGAENIGLAIPINVVKRDLDDWKKFGQIKRPFLGIRYLIINEEIKNRFNLPVIEGAFIVNEGIGRPAIIEGSPAEKAGLKEKDIVLEINDKKISLDKTLGDFLENLSVGDSLKLKVLRGKREFKTAVILAERK
ncbi:MAG: Protease Do [Candidatus Wolfebacteria bacterium GW2011_GWC1_37_10]|uniref:Protease Do n=2 Tax=Candidatus Wolfeibacteriota TaxID=1752735 RepID=A0A0G0J4D4_9BACT|nr:MAG: Protease Do [Candidatus Wolfebacteria bacterium GW2011_GWC1_37_10]